MAKVPPGNLSPEAPSVIFKPDCGRLPFWLRAYYAYRMRLPFSYQHNSNNDINIKDPSKDGRYNDGNTITGHVDQMSEPSLSNFFRVAVFDEGGRCRLRPQIERTA
jgi:hypothetical protein